MAEIVEITYRANENAPLEGYGLLGGYRVRYDDGFNVLLPHTGEVGTVGAIPLDPDDEEHRAVLAESAERMRMQHDVETEIELWRMADGGGPTP